MYYGEKDESDKHDEDNDECRCWSLPGGGEENTRPDPAAGSGYFIPGLVSIFALFPFNSLLTHPEALRVSSSEMTQTRAPEFANQCKLCSEHIIRSPIRKANIRPVWRKEKKRKCAIKLVREEKIFLTNKLKHCVPESERKLRCLHLMFAKADSPDSNVESSSRDIRLSVT